MRTIPVAVVAALVAAAAPNPAGAQTACWRRGTPEQQARRPSRPDSATVQLGDVTLKLCYSRPSARGRTMVGGVDPLGQPWRLGANEATALHVPVAVEIAGVRVEPGSYSLYAIPGESQWLIVVNRGAERWGIPINEQLRGADVGSASLAVERLGEHVEQLSLRFTPPARNATELIVEWEHARVRIPIRRVGG